MTLLVSNQEYKSLEILTWHTQCSHDVISNTNIVYFECDHKSSIEEKTTHKELRKMKLHVCTTHSTGYFARSKNLNKNLINTKKTPKMIANMEGIPFLYLNYVEHVN